MSAATQASPPLMVAALVFMLLGPVIFMFLVVLGGGGTLVLASFMDSIFSGRGSLGLIIIIGPALCAICGIAVALIPGNWHWLARGVLAVAAGVATTGIFFSFFHRFLGNSIWWLMLAGGITSVSLGGMMRGYAAPDPDPGGDGGGAP